MVNAGEIEGWVMGGLLWVDRGQLPGHVPGDDIGLELVPLLEWARCRGLDRNRVYAWRRQGRLEVADENGRWWIPANHPIPT